MSLNSAGKAVCTICTEATTKELFSINSRLCLSSRRAYVENGFDKWKNAVMAFNCHEKSELHRSASVGLSNLKQQCVVQSLSAAKQKEMVASRVALRKIFSTVNVLAQQGLALRGNDNDERSNLYQILKIRAEDVPALKSNRLYVAAPRYNKRDSRNSCE